MMAPGPLGDVIVSLCCVSAAWPSALVRWDRMNGTWKEKRGGVDPRAATDRVFPHQTAAQCTRGLVPPALKYAFGIVVIFVKNRDFRKKHDFRKKILTCRKKTRLFEKNRDAS